MRSRKLALVWVGHLCVALMLLFSGCTRSSVALSRVPQRAVPRLNAVSERVVDIVIAGRLYVLTEAGQVYGHVYDPEGNRFGRGTLVPIAQPVVAIEGKRHETCALTWEGDVYCWGESPGTTANPSPPSRLCDWHVDGTSERPQLVLRGANRLLGQGVEFCAGMDTAEVVCWADYVWGQRCPRGADPVYEYGCEPCTVSSPDVVSELATSNATQCIVEYDSTGAWLRCFDYHRRLGGRIRRIDPGTDVVLARHGIVCVHQGDTGELSCESDAGQHRASVVLPQGFRVGASLFFERSIYFWDRAGGEPVSLSLGFEVDIADMSRLTGLGHPIRREIVSAPNVVRIASWTFAACVLDGASRVRCWKEVFDSDEIVEIGLPAALSPGP